MIDCCGIIVDWERKDEGCYKVIVFLLGTYAIMAFKQEITLEEHHDSYPGDGNSVN